MPGKVSSDHPLQKQLKRLGVVPNRVLGQNFLTDVPTARGIVDALELAPDDVVIEAGPGLGALTDHLAGRCRRLVLLEKDPKLAGWLRRRHAGQPEIEVVEGDAAAYDFRPLFREGPVKFIGNLPYSGATEILLHFLRPPTPVARAVVMVQREVAERLCAGPGSKAYGVLSLLLQFHWRPELLRVIGGELFHPVPEVESGIIRFEPRPADSLAPHCPAQVEDLVRRGFSQRRKQLHNNLALDRDTWDRAAGSLNLPLTVRGEALTLEQWIALANELDTHPCARAGGTNPDEIFDVVDENDEVAGQRRRAEVHAEKLLHRAVHVFLFNAAGELYLQQRSALKDTHKLKWDSSASGHLDAGEGYEDSARRELWEELMCRPRRPLERLAKLSASPATDQEFVEIYRAESKGRPRVHTSEILAGAFFPPAEIARWIEARPQDFARGFIACFRAVM